MINEKAKITTEDIKGLLLNVYKRFRSGRIQAEQAKQESYLLKTCLEAVSEAETNERLNNLSDIMRGA